MRDQTHSSLFRLCSSDFVAHPQFTQGNNHQWHFPHFVQCRRTAFGSQAFGNSSESGYILSQNKDSSSLGKQSQQSKLELENQIYLHKLHNTF